jgi:hypothetical protein
MVSPPQRNSSEAAAGADVVGDGDDVGVPAGVAGAVSAGREASAGGRWSVGATEAQPPTSIDVVTTPRSATRRMTAPDTQSKIIGMFPTVQR